MKTVSNDELMNAMDVIQRRQSIRSFDTSYSSEEIVNKLMDYVNLLKRSPFKGEARFESLSIENFDRSLKRRLGTYGFVKGANTFLIGITKDELTYDLENFGYLFEKAILYATNLNIGTVWLGGTFKRSAFESQINLRSKEKIPAITPIGFPQKKQALRSRFIRYMAKGEHRKPFSTIFFNGDFSIPLHKSSLAVFADVLEMVRLSPSASNRQPWRIVKEREKNIFHFFITRNKPRSHRLFSWPDFKRIDLGIAACHFDLTVKQLGISGEWRITKPEIYVPDQYDYSISWFETPSQ
ncbi:MAG: nitroreductase family protein [Candidatus Hodarchaeales archaeon]